jgi:FkbH-like protein
VWATEWGRSSGPEPRSPETPSALDVGSVELVRSLVWAEHCIECAIPDCYAVCPLYVERADHKCARFKFGIYANPRFGGLFEFGADVHFRRWGRLEAPLGGGAASPRRLRQFAKIERVALALINPVAGALERVDPKRKLNGVYRVASDYGLARATRRGAYRTARFDEFVIEVFNPNPDPVGLIIEVQQDHPVFRTSFRLEPGANVQRIPAGDLGAALDGPGGRLLVYPENDAEVRLIFRWLDLVRYKPGRRPAGLETTTTSRPNSLARPTGASRAAHLPVIDRAAAAPAAKHVADAKPTPAAKVKCVAWDLDNTLWSGVLVEDGPAALAVRPGVVELIKALDERGILNTIVSKNDHDPAWGKVTELGLNEYFVSPAINWGPKSANLKAVAELLNFNVDTFVMIDDSAFERAEVASELPQVRVVAETEIATLLERPEFDVPVSSESKQRRFSYLAEDTRRAIAASTGGSYEDFLKGCEMKTELFHPTSPEQRERVLELLLRSNQLNLSTRRYTSEELAALLADEAVLSLGFECSDRYGEYGIVGFLAVSMAGPVPILRDLVISCRVAKKKVENAIFKWLATQFSSRGIANLEAGYVPTSRNHVLLDALTEVGFAPTVERDGMQILDLVLDREVPAGKIVEIEAAAVAIPGAAPS